MDRNKLKILLGFVTALFLVVAVVLFVLALSLDIATLPKVVLIIVSVLALALSIELAYFTYLLVDKNPNYFLYNPRMRRNSSVQNLTFETVNARMNRFLAKYATSEGKIWNERVLDNPYLEMPEEFKPLVAYKLLFGLAANDSEAGWRCLENASYDTVRFICNGLRANGDAEFASAIEKIMTQKPVNIKVIRDYLVRNKRYVQKKMLSYTVENIEKF